MSDQPDPLTQQGLVVGSIQQAAVDASRKAYAVFGEVSVPIVKTLEMQAALRYDHYPTDSKTSPKIGLYWTPLKQLAFRASYTESFRMPSLKQLYGAQDQGAANINDPASCVLLGFDPDCDVAIFEVSGSNPSLEAGEGQDVECRRGDGRRSLFRHRRLVADRRGLIRSSRPTSQSAIEQGLFGRDHEWTRSSSSPTCRTPQQARNEGVDVDLRLRFPGTIVGNVTIPRYRHVLHNAAQPRSRRRMGGL